MNNYFRGLKKSLRNNDVDCLIQSIALLIHDGILTHKTQMHNIVVKQYAYVWRELIGDLRNSYFTCNRMC
jgi:hypothetical protein